jgi:DNA polymerase-3 subunit delta'
VRVQGLDLPAREAEQRVRRAARGAERDELLAQLEELAAWYRDLVVVAVGAREAAVHVDRLAELEEDATRERLLGAERAAEAVRETWRALEEFNLAPLLALEALFVRIARELQV